LLILTGLILFWCFEKNNEMFVELWWGFLFRIAPMVHSCGILAGSNLRSTLAITKGWCSPAFPANLYDRSNPFGPQTLISQPSLSREPTIDTRQSPGLSPRWCSTST
jgi:hypothetical protein